MRKMRKLNLLTPFFCMMKQYFEFQDDKSSKFWEIILKDAKLKTRYCKIGSEGQATENHLIPKKKARNNTYMTMK